MSVRPVNEPRCDEDESPIVELVIEPRPRDLGGFSVRRVLPAAERRMVGPFVFFDHMGPAEMAIGEGVDVRPHPHIRLATVTYLFEGEIVHRDSLGYCQPIRPGAINWMTAGRGIVHSERSAPERRAEGVRLHGLQLWVALPDEHEDVDPSFDHYPAEAIPVVESEGVRVRVLAGEAFGQRSPVRTLSPLFYCEVLLDPGASVSVPTEHEERAAYLVEGAVSCDNERHAPGRMLVFAKDRSIALVAEEPARLVLLGGAPVGPRHIWWNFVSSDREAIEVAKRAWKERRFPTVPGDEVEYIPLPEG